MNFIEDIILLESSSPGALDKSCTKVCKLTKMPKKGPKLNLKQQNPDPPPSVPNLPPDLDKKASITVGQVIFEIEADDLEVICELGR